MDCTRLAPTRRFAERAGSRRPGRLATEGPMCEYACHEGSHDIRHIQEVYRNLERQEAEAAR